MNKKNRRIIFLHGGPGFEDYLAPSFKKRFSRNFDTKFYTQGCSSTISIKTLINQLDFFIGKPSKKTWLLGHSWGATLALEYIKRHPEKISGLILISPSLKSKDFYNEFEKELKLRNISRFDRISIFFSRKERKLGEKFLKNLDQYFDAKIFRAFERGFLKNFDEEKILIETQIPILLVYGDSDIRVPSRILSSVQYLNPRIQSLEIKDAGHFPFLLSKNRNHIFREATKFIRSSSHTHSSRALNGKMIQLLPPQIDHFSQLHQILNDKQTMAALIPFFGRDQWTMKQVHERYRNFLDQERLGKGLSYTVVLRSSGKIVGSCSLKKMSQKKRVADFGLILHRSVWGTGVAQECHLLCLDYSFKVLKLKKIRFTTDDHNLRMQRFFERVGIPRRGRSKEGYLLYELTSLEYKKLSHFSKDP